MYYTERMGSFDLTSFEWTDIGDVCVCAVLERRISKSVIRQKVTFYADSAVIRLILM